MKKYILDILKSDGKLSSKRLISVMAFLMMCIGFISNLFWEFKIDEHIYRSMELIVEIGMGTIVAEKFGKQRQTTDTNGDTGGILDAEKPQ